MKYYVVEMVLKLEDDATPRKWVPNVVTENLESGEDLLTYRFEEVTLAEAEAF
jgi:hypothetical protein